jgi:hypothetical protein
MTPCAVGGCREVGSHRAHVKPREDFPEEVPFAETFRMNIIRLCPTHHNEYFDRGLMGIYPDKLGFLIQADQFSPPVAVPAAVSIRQIRDEYVEWKNQLAVPDIQFRLGRVVGYEYGRIVPPWEVGNSGRSRGVAPTGVVGSPPSAGDRTATGRARPPRTV